ncbi:mediator of RNA polymerase II transcription subunit 15-like [Frankliniella occidentalis]|uniref:Mediator of RNA polymerase II transcription subunit 15-like n=1 Tax=Frankliniella occidentalis TaxID=133901 RepID=A0A9C6XV10_FRAOC|nr:mediator of RNA polymerase II transcription subunit 15-like [Frankliniella occidentalis]
MVPARAQDLGLDTFSMPVSYSMPAPAAYSAHPSAPWAVAAPSPPAKKSAVLQHFKSIRGSTSTTPRVADEDSTATPPRYSSSYNSQRVQLQVRPDSQPAARQDEQALMQKQQSYQNLHDYQALSKNSYQNLASLQDQSQQQPQQQAYQSYQQKQAHQQQQAHQQGQQYGSQDQTYSQQKQDQQYAAQDQTYSQQQVYQQKAEQQKKPEPQVSEEETDEHQQLQQTGPQQDKPTKTYTANVLSYAQGQGQATSPAPSQPVPNAVSIEEAVAAAAAVTQTPELAPLTPEEAQRIFAQQQELRQQQQQYMLSQQQQQHPHQRQQPQQQSTTAQYERYYEAAAATGVTPNPYLAPTHLYTTPALGVGAVVGAPVRGAVLPHYKQGANLVVGAGGASSPVMQAAVNYYKNGYYADPSLMYQLGKTPYRRVSGPAPRPRPRPRPHHRPHAHAHLPHAHAHVAPYRYKSSAGPQVQHFFHGPYTMEAAVGANPGAGASPDAWIEHAIAPIKRDDSLLSGLGTAPGSSTALLNGLLVPIVLLGLSIPALGFAYSYLSRRRAFDNDVASFVQNLRPDEETIDYYFNMLQKSIECFSDPKLSHCE